MLILHTYIYMYIHIHTHIIEIEQNYHRNCLELRPMKDGLFWGRGEIFFINILQNCQCTVTIQKTATTLRTHRGLFLHPQGPKILRWSSPLYKMVQCLHVTYHMFPHTINYLQITYKTQKCYVGSDDSILLRGQCRGKSPYVFSMVAAILGLTMQYMHKTRGEC